MSKVNPYTEYKRFFIKELDNQYFKYRIYLMIIKPTGKIMPGKALRKNYYNYFWEYSSLGEVKEEIDALCDPANVDHSYYIQRVKTEQLSELKWL